MIGRLSIETTPAVIGMRTTRARLTVSNSSNAQVQMNSRPASFRMNTQVPRVKIDQSQAFASAGNAPILQLSSQNAKNSLSMGLEAIGKMVDDGNYIGNLFAGGNRVAQLAFENSLPNYEFNAVAMPSVGPDITLVRQDPNIEWEPYQLNISTIPQQMSVEYIPGSLEIYMEQYPEINISYIIDSIGFPLGNNIDRII